MVKNVEQTINTDHQMIDMMRKLKNQLEEYKKNRKNFPKDSDGMYILLEGAITVKNNFNSDDPEGVLLDAKGEKKFPPHELYPKQEKQSTSDRHKTVVKNDRPEMLDVFGLERFLFVQGYSYYGSVYATSNEKQPTSHHLNKQQLVGSSKLKTKVSKVICISTGDSR